MAIRILIVDDEPHLRKVMRLALQSDQYEVLEASSGEEALDLMSGAKKADVVLLDERMPGIDGLETLRRLSEYDPKPVVIMVTAFASIELAVDAMKLGATDFVRKPMSPDTLRTAVDGALAKARGGWPATPVLPTPTVAGERAFEVSVMNGFRVIHTAYGSSASEHHFGVTRRDPVTARQVTVQFAEEVVAAASEEAGRPLANDQAFWRRQAGLALASYVWMYADVPPDGRLVVTQMSRDILKGAQHVS